MEHPLQNPSLCPYGLLWPAGKKRLEYKSQLGNTNPEKLIMKLWDKANRLSASGVQPARRIIYDIMPATAAVNRFKTGDFVFDGLPYITRDIYVLNSVVRWLGTNCGRYFTEPKQTGSIISANELLFLKKLHVLQRQKDYPSYLHHWLYEGSIYDSRFVCHRHELKDKRDLRLIEGLMRWLGKKEGLLFINAFSRKLESSNKAFL